MVGYLNQDKLYIKFGTEEGTSKENAGEAKTFGDRRETIVVLNLVDLNTSTEVILNDVTALPKNAQVEEVEVEVQVAATSSGSATLDIGLIKPDRTTDIDADGLAAAVALSTINAVGKRLNLIAGSTGAGALIGTKPGDIGLFVAKAGTAVFTAGVLRIRVKWFAA